MPKPNVGPRGTAASSALPSPQTGTCVRSLGIMEELQDYIGALENVAASRKVELDRLRDEKHGVEKMLYHFQQKEGATRQGELFTSLQRADMPPRMRAILEDNKMLVDKVRKYKMKSSIAERMITDQRKHFTRYNDEIRKLRLQLKMAQKKTNFSTTSESQRTLIAKQKRDINTLEHNVEVLMKKNETDAKGFKYLLSGARKEKESLQRQIDALKTSLVDKENELRHQTIETKKAQRISETARKSLESLQKKKSRHSSAAVEYNRSPACEQSLIPVVEPVVEPIVEPETKVFEEPQGGVCSVQVMLCVVNDTTHAPSPTAELPNGCLPPVDEIGIAPCTTNAGDTISEEQAAIRIQANYRGFKTRRDIQDWRAEEMEDGPSVMVIPTRSSEGGEKEGRQATSHSPSVQTSKKLMEGAEERAATAIQAATRGMQARKKVEKMKLDKLVKDSGSHQRVKSTAHHSNWIYRHQQNQGRGKNGGNTKGYKMMKPGNQR